MNAKQTERRLRDVLRRKTRINQPGRLIAHLQNELGVATDRNNTAHKNITSALESLERRGEIVLERSGSVFNGVQYVGCRDRTDRTPQEKREAMFAKGVPAVLPDELCTPVVITSKEPILVPESVTPTEAVDSSQLPTKVILQPYKVGQKPYHQTLTDCLSALRSEADENGVGHQLSVSFVLKALLDMTDSQALRAMDHLRGMELYTTSMTGFATSSYTVVLEPAVVTAQMVTSYRRSLGSSQEQQEAEASSSEQQPVTDPIGQLVEIIEQQERKLTDTVSDLNKVNDELSAVVADRDDLAQKLTASEHKLNQAMAEIEAIRANNTVVDLRVAQVLERYTG